MAEMINVIQQSVEFEKTIPEELFGILMDPRKHSEIIKAEARISRREGDSFSAFNGMVTGKNLAIVPNKLIVQSWRGNVWNEDDLDSIVMMTFTSTKRGAKIDLVHANVPEQFVKVEKWKEVYWEPMKAYLSSKSVK
jgi:activator of HSP90 ATPase